MNLPYSPPSIPGFFSEITCRGWHSNTEQSSAVVDDVAEKSAGGFGGNPLSAWETETVRTRQRGLKATLWRLGGAVIPNKKSKSGRL